MGIIIIITSVIINHVMTMYCFLWYFIIYSPHNFFSQAIKHPHFIDEETEVQGSLLLQAVSF